MNEMFAHMNDVVNARRNSVLPAVGLEDAILAAKSAVDAKGLRIYLGVSDVRSAQESLIYLISRYQTEPREAKISLLDNIILVATALRELLRDGSYDEPFKLSQLLGGI